VPDCFVARVAEHGLSAAIPEFDDTIRRCGDQRIGCFLDRQVVKAYVHSPLDLDQEHRRTARCRQGLARQMRKTQINSHIALLDCTACASRLTCSILHWHIP
jgi:hypothetical protein